MNGAGHVTLTFVLYHHWTCRDFALSGVQMLNFGDTTWIKPAVTWPETL